MSVRRLQVLVAGLPPDSATVNVSRAAEPAPPDNGTQSHTRALAPVRCLEDVPVAASLAEVGQFVNADGDEFSERYGESA